jgi:hypothetical protein
MRFRIYRILYAGVFPVNNFLLFPAFFLFLLSGDANVRKQILWQEFAWAHMRDLPESMAHYRRLKEFDVVFQKSDIPRADALYPHTYVIGLYKPSLGRFERKHLLSRVNPFMEYGLVKAVSDHYHTDTTYLDVLLRDRKNRLESVVYRKAKPATLLAVAGEQVQESTYVMWKKERIVLQDGLLTTRLIEKWNKERFE